MSSTLRLQLFLAQAGVASRRKAEELILAGRVEVNGEVVRELGTKIDPAVDQVTFEGRRVSAEGRIWILLNKPAGTICTASDPQGRRTVLDLVGPQGARLFPVGRLDFNTEGVLLLTNDGELAHALMHPKNEVRRVYHVKLKGIVDPEDLERLSKGVTLDTGEKVSADVSILGTTDKNTWIRMTLTQGLNRQIHRMVACIGGTVLKLVRVAYADLTTHLLRPGKYRSLTADEVNALRQAVHLEKEPARPARASRSRRTHPVSGTPRRKEKAAPPPGRATRGKEPSRPRRPPKRPSRTRR